MGPAETGTSLAYRLQQNGAEAWSADSTRSYRWTVKDAHGTSFVDQTTDRPELSLRAANPGQYTITVAVLSDGNPVSGMVYQYQQNVYIRRDNTDLGGLSVGNFEFKYDGAAVNINARMKFAFEDGITATEQQAFKNKFFTAVRNTWGNHGKTIQGTAPNGSTFNIPINITSTEVTDNSYHKIVDVQRDHRRNNVIRDLNTYLGVSGSTLAHEFGHVLGLYDEYDGGWLENSMFWHDNDHMHDTNAMMNSGYSGMRDRYFEHYREAVEDASADGYSYEVQ